MQKYLKTKILLAFVLSLFLTQASPAQILLGVFGGASNNSLSGDAPEDVVYGSRLGLIAGLNAELQLGAHTNLFMQPAYMQRGIKIGYDIGEDEPHDSLLADMNYFSLPVGIKFYSANELVFFSGGFEYAYLLDAKTKPIEENEGSENDIKEILKEHDLSFFFGFGMNFRIGYPRLGVELRYTSGFINAYSGAPSNAFDIPARFRMTNFRLIASLNFPIGIKEGKKK